MKHGRAYIVESQLSPVQPATLLLVRSFSCATAVTAIFRLVDSVVGGECLR